MLRITFSLIVLFALIKSLCAQEPLSLKDFRSFIESKNPQVWQHFRDFDKLVRVLSEDEQREYEQAQRVDLDLKTGNAALIERLDLIAFQRAYPHLASALGLYAAKVEFRNRFHKKYSYGWKRWFAFANRRTANKLAKETNLKHQTVFLDLMYSYAKKSDPTKKHISQKFLFLSFDQLTKLAICDGYKPAVMDVMRAARVTGELKLSPALSYLAMLRVEQYGLRVVFKDKWMAEFDQELSEAEKKKFEALVGDKDRLHEELSYCS